jgi:hypothetical protein
MRFSTMALALTIVGLHDSARAQNIERLSGYSIEANSTISVKYLGSNEFEENRREVKLYISDKGRIFDYSRSSFRKEGAHADAGSNSSLRVVSFGENWSQAGSPIQRKWDLTPDGLTRTWTYPSGLWQEILAITLSGDRRTCVVTRTMKSLRPDGKVFHLAWADGHPLEIVEQHVQSNTCRITPGNLLGEHAGIAQPPTTAKPTQIEVAVDAEWVKAQPDAKQEGYAHHTFSLSLVKDAEIVEKHTWDGGHRNVALALGVSEGGIMWRTLPGNRLQRV